MSSPPVVPGSPTPSDFASELERLTEPVRRAFRRLLADWGGPGSAADFDRVSGGGATVCWQVFRVANSSDAMAEAKNVPTPTSLKRLLAAAPPGGVPPATLAAVEAAVRDFHAFRKRVASDRSAFESMLSGVTAQEQTEPIPLALRRTAYRAVSSINGVQADLIYTGTLVRAGADAGTCDQVGLIVSQGIRRLRPDADLTLYGSHRPADGEAGAAETPLDADAAHAHGMPILPEFSDTLPPVERVELMPGFVTHRVTGLNVGLQASIDCAFGRSQRATPLLRDTDGRRLYHASYSYIRRPVALGIHEVLVHRPSYPRVRVRHMAFQYTGGDRSQAACRAAQQYTLQQKLVKIGRADIATLADLPRYRELLQFGAGRVGWDLSEFDVYRTRLPYPIVFSTERIYFYVD